MLQGVIEVLTSYQNFFHSFWINFEIVFKLIKSKQKKLKYSLHSLNGHLCKTDTQSWSLPFFTPSIWLSIRRTSLSDWHILQIPKASVSERVDFTVLAVASNFVFFFFCPFRPKSVRVYLGLNELKGRSWNIKTGSTRKLSNFDFQWTKILYQNNFKHIAFFLTFFKG